MPQLLRPSLLLLLLASIALPARLHAQEVTIYRCIGAAGKLTLRDSPCAKGETQEVRSMQRPKDPAPVALPVTKAAPPPAPAPPREVQVIYRTPPRPMYECVTADGEQYTSDNGEGNPRSVPLWTLGYPMWSHRGAAAADHTAEPGRPIDRRPPSVHLPGVIVPGGYTWVRDECHALPQQEVCSRLSTGDMKSSAVTTARCKANSPLGAGTARHRCAHRQRLRKLSMKFRYALPILLLLASTGKRGRSSVLSLHRRQRRIDLAEHAMSERRQAGKEGHAKREHGADGGRRVGEAGAVQRDARTPRPRRRRRSFRPRRNLPKPSRTAAPSPRSRIVCRLRFFSNARPTTRTPTSPKARNHNRAAFPCARWAWTAIPRPAPAKPAR